MTGCPHTRLATPSLGRLLLLVAAVVVGVPVATVAAAAVEHAARVRRWAARR